MSELLLDKDIPQEQLDQEFALMVADYGAIAIGHEVHMRGYDDQGHSTDKPEEGRHPADSETGIVPPPTREHEPDPTDDGEDDIDLDRDMKLGMMASSGLLEYGPSWPEAAGEGGDDDEDDKEGTQDPPSLNIPYSFLQGSRRDLTKIKDN